MTQTINASNGRINDKLMSGVLYRHSINTLLIVILGVLYLVNLDSNYKKI